MPHPNDIQWREIDLLPQLAPIIKEMLEGNREQLDLFKEAQDRPHVLDDAIVGDSQRLYRSQLEDLAIYEEQGQRWLQASLSEEQKTQVKQFLADVQEAGQATRQLLSLLEEISQGTIDKIMAMSDLEVGIHAIEQERKRRRRAGKPLVLSANERNAQKIDAFVLDTMKSGGGDEAILTNMLPYMHLFKRILDTGGPREMDRLCAEYPGFYHFAKLLENLAGAIQRGDIQVPD